MNRNAMRLTAATLLAGEAVSLIAFWIAWHRLPSLQRVIEPSGASEQFAWFLWADLCVLLPLCVVSAAWLVTRSPRATIACAMHLAAAVYATAWTVAASLHSGVSWTAATAMLGLSCVAAFAVRASRMERG